MPLLESVDTEQGTIQLSHLCTRNIGCNLLGRAGCGEGKKEESGVGAEMKKHANKFIGKHKVIVSA